MYSVDQLVEILDCARAARTRGQGHEEEKSGR